MPHRRFALEPGSAAHLDLDWRSGWRDLSFRFDGELIATTSRGGLEAGFRFEMPDGSRVDAQLIRWALFFPELHVRRNGRAMPGSAGDPNVQLASASNVLFVIAALTVALGAVLAFVDLPGVNIATIMIGGAIFAAMGLLVRLGSVTALAMASLIYLADSVLLLSNWSHSGVGALGGIFTRLIFFLALLGGFRALRSRREMRPPVRETKAPERASIGAGPRCPRHQIALAADGSCVVCRREQGLSRPPPAKRVGPSPVISIVSGLSSVILAAGYLFAARDQFHTLVVRTPEPDVSPFPRGINRQIAPTAHSVEPSIISDAATVPAVESANERALHAVVVELFGRNACPTRTDRACRQTAQARDWFQQNSVEFRNYDVDRDPAAAAAIRHVGTIPVIRIDGVDLPGWDEFAVPAAIEAATRHRRLVASPDASH